ncbi:MAG: DUF4442 domain-containing protein [Pseudomonadota bacterium]
MDVGERLRRVYRWPAGPWLVARAIAFTAPYSASIRPRIIELSDGVARVALADRRSVRNHLASIHACALATLTETTVGLSVLFTLPPEVRGIATELEMSYRRKARGTITASCRWKLPQLSPSADLDIPVALDDADGQRVADGRVRFRFSAKPARRP